MDQSRGAPSSWELEVRRMFGHAGQLGFHCSFHSGGRGMISNWCTSRAPMRIAVPTQSDPVSPPPMTRTILSFA